MEKLPFFRSANGTPILFYYTNKWMIRNYIVKEEITESFEVNLFQEAEFHWTSVEKGIILSSFSWGFLRSPVGGILAIKLFGFGMMGTAMLTILTPVLIRQHFMIYLVGRFMEGVGEVCQSV